jgi:hypothetical protein
MKLPYWAKGFEVPAPALKIRLLQPVTRAKETVIARIDSGADITSIPFTVLEKLNLNAVGHGFVSGYDDPGKSHLLFACSLQFRSLSFENIKVIAASTPEALIGLDVLNTLHICLDGNKRQFEIIDEQKSKRRR